MVWVSPVDTDQADQTLKEELVWQGQELRYHFFSRGALAQLSPPHLNILLPSRTGGPGRLVPVCTFSFEMLAGVFAIWRVDGLIGLPLCTAAQPPVLHSQLQHAYGHIQRHSWVFCMNCLDTDRG